MVTGELDRSQFHSFADHVLEVSGVQIEATIIGASHVVTFGTGLFQLHEVFACDGPKNVPSWHLNQLVTAPVEQQLPGMKYEFGARRVPWEDPEPAELLELEATASRYQASGVIGLVQNFPQGDCAATPKTIVAVTGDESQVVVVTAHSYPNARGLVLSRSILTHT